MYTINSTGAGAGPLVVATTLVGCFYRFVKNVVNPSKGGNFVAVSAITFVVVVTFCLTYSFVAPSANIIAVVVVLASLAGRFSTVGAISGCFVERM